MSAIKLSPCPFCGGDAEIEQRGTPRMSTIYACTDCGCRLETGEEWDHGHGWNRRADEGLVDGLRRAVEFHDRVVTSPPAEREAARTDHLDWLINAARALVNALPATGGKPGGNPG